VWHLRVERKGPGNLPTNEGTRTGLDNKGKHNHNTFFRTDTKLGYYHNKTGESNKGEDHSREMKEEGPVGSDTGRNRRVPKTGSD